MNAWKDGRDADARHRSTTTGNEVRGLPWRSEVSTDVFECASVNAAQALANWSKSRKGERAGKPVGFPRFKSRHKTAPAFRLRAKYSEGSSLAGATVRASKRSGSRSSGSCASTSTPRSSRRCLARAGSTSTPPRSGSSGAAGSWPITGVAAELHDQRRTTTSRDQGRVGVDLGVKTLAVVADEHGRVLHAHQGVKALQHAQARLKLANQKYSRTKRDSVGRKKAARRLGKIHARVTHLRRNLLHQITTELARGYTTVVLEDLNAAGMLHNRKLAGVVSDAAFGEFRRRLDLQGRLVRHGARSRRPVVPVDRRPLGLWIHRPRPDALGPRVYDSCGLVARPGRQRRDQRGPLHRAKTEDLTATPWPPDACVCEPG